MPPSDVSLEHRRRLTVGRDPQCAVTARSSIPFRGLIRITRADLKTPDFDCDDPIQGPIILCLSHRSTWPPASMKVLARAIASLSLPESIRTVF
jgi:hypothetical protein